MEENDIKVLKDVIKALDENNKVFKLTRESIDEKEKNKEDKEKE